MFDKNTVPLQLKTNPLFTEQRWHTIIDEEGNTMSHKGLHVVNDGGYHHWLQTIHGWKPDEAPDDVLAVGGALFESTRKNVECCFGIMKRRHRVLKVPSLREDYNDIDAVFKTCGILHNMLLQFDGFDTIGTRDEDWMLLEEYENLCLEDLDVDVEGWRDEDLLEEIRLNDIRARRTACEQLVMGGAVAAVRADTDLAAVRGQSPDGDAVETEEGFQDRQMAISKHIYMCLKGKKLMRVLPAKQCRPVIDRPIRGYAGPWLGM
jgi:hypothetical protein